MKYNIELLKADVREELEKLSKLEKEFQGIQEKLSLNEHQVPPYDRGAIGFILHSFYNGCENIFRAIARFFENDIEPQTWHRNLLKRMKYEVEGYRPPVIDDALFQLVTALRKSLDGPVKRLCPAMTSSCIQNVRGVGYRLVVDLPARLSESYE